MNKVTEYVVSRIEPGHMGLPYYFQASKHNPGSGAYICAVSLFPDRAVPGDRITVEYRYELYGGPWRVDLNGRTVFQMTMEQVKEERRAEQQFVADRMKKLRQP